MNFLYYFISDCKISLGSDAISGLTDVLSSLENLHTLELECKKFHLFFLFFVTFKILF